MIQHDLSLRDLQAVSAVAAHGHFGRAAAALRVAQPTLSSRVQRVERALGVTFFERAGRRFFITRAGERLLPLVRETLSRAERIGLEAQAEVQAGAGPLRLGVIPTLGPYLIPHILLPLSREGGAFSLRIGEHPTAQLFEGLRSGELDAALLSLPFGSDTLEFLPLFDEPFLLIAPRSHPLASATRLTVASLNAGDMVLLEEGHCLRDQALALCRPRGGSTPRLVTTSLETLKYLVAAGEGYSLLPRLAGGVAPELEGLVAVREFDARRPSRRVGLCFRRSLTARDQVLALGRFILGHLPPGLLPLPHGGGTTPRGQRGSSARGRAVENGSE